MASLKSEDLFHPKGREKVRETLERIVSSQWRQSLADDDSVPNSQITEEELAPLADEMLKTATLKPDGVHFLALGSHHSAFETTLAYAGLRLSFTDDVNAALAQTH